jgi:hypothetical protein
MAHYALATLAECGLAAIAMATRYFGQRLQPQGRELPAGHRAAITAARSRGYARVLLVGDSGCGSGRAPLYDLSELRGAGVQVALYPLSAFRAMSRAAQLVYETIRRDGTQRAVLDIMETRSERYDVLD